MTAGGDAGRDWTIYCEGYHDRAFLAGLFAHGIGLSPYRAPARRSRHRGAYEYQLSTGLVRIVPAGNDDAAVEALRNDLRLAEAFRPAGLVLCLDCDDARDVQDAMARTKARLDAAAGAVLGDGYDRRGGRARLAGGGVVALTPVVWCCEQPAADAQPARHNLEHLIIAAVCSAYPHRGPAVRAWLESRPDAPTGAAHRDKSFSWSLMAGWYASPGGEAFFQQLWLDLPVRQALLARLPTTGLQDVLLAMGLSPPTASSTATPPAS